MKHLWASGEKSHALDQMKAFSKFIGESLGLQTVAHLQALTENNKSHHILSLLSRSYLKIGEWLVSFQHDWNEVSLSNIEIYTRDS